MGGGPMGGGPMGGGPMGAGAAPHKGSKSTGNLVLDLRGTGQHRKGATQQHDFSSQPLVNPPVAGAGIAGGVAGIAAPPFLQLQIPPNCRKLLLGRGGETIRNLQEEFSLFDIRVEESGLVTIVGAPDKGIVGEENMQRARYGFPVIRFLKICNEPGTSFR